MSVEVRLFLITLTYTMTVAISVASPFVRSPVPVPANVRNPFAALNARGAINQPRLGLDAVVDVVKLWRVAGFVKTLETPERSAAILHGKFIRVGDSFPVQIAGTAARVRVLVVADAFLDLEVSASGQARTIRILSLP